VIDFYADPEEDDTEAQDMDVDEAA